MLIGFAGGLFKRHHRACKTLWNGSMNVVREKRSRPSAEVVQSPNISTCTYGIRFNQEGHSETRGPHPNAKHAMQYILRRTLVTQM